MGDILSIASTLLTRAQSRVEMASKNIANMNTSGYRRGVNFATYIEGSDTRSAEVSEKSINEFSPGKYVISKNPLSLAVEGNGFFVVSNGTSIFYTREGEFRLRDGVLMDRRGYVLQSAEGGDLRVGDAIPTFAADGIALSNGEPVGRVAIADFADRSALTSADGSLFSGAAEAATPVERPAMRQGMAEGSNVSMADEMVRMMAAMRSAETGQRLVQTYDELLGRALTAFGGN